MAKKKSSTSKKKSKTISGSKKKTKKKAASKTDAKPASMRPASSKSQFKSSKSQSKSSGDAKACAMLAYLLIGIIWYFADENMKKVHFAGFHVKQGLALILTSIIGTVILGIIPIIGWMILPVFQLVIVILLIVGLINAANGKESELPIIGGMGRKFSF